MWTDPGWRGLVDSLALNDFGADDVPDVTPRPLDELVAWANSVNEHRDQGRYSLVGRGLGTLLTELQAHSLTAGGADRDRAFTAFVQSCILAGDVAKALAGNIDLAISAARRGYDMASRQFESAMTPSPRTSLLRWTVVLRVGYVSWTACVTASRLAVRVHGVWTASRRSH